MHKEVGLRRGGEGRTYEVPGDATPRGPTVGGDVGDGAHDWVASVSDADVEFDDTALGDLVLSGHRVATLGDEIGWYSGRQR